MPPSEQIPGQGADAGPADDMVGTVLAGRYRILKKLGEGAMGAVYLAEHVKIGRKDAIKVLRGPMARDPEAIARFTRGARNVSAIRHPNVCAIYDFSDTSDGLQFMAMEFVPGNTLKEILEQEGALDPARAAAIAKQVADALQAAHDVGIVHRDLKPGNIMVANERGRESVKVVDFDIAKGPRDGEGSEVTRLGFVVGTPEYMSPEQLMGERLDGRSDVYSLALVLFRMLTGSLPFRADTTQDVMLQRLTEQPLRLEQAAPGGRFPAGLQAVIDRGLQRRAMDRYDSAASFGKDVVAALEGQPLSAAAVPPTPAGTGSEPLQETVVSPRATSSVAVPTTGASRGRRGLLIGAGATLAVVVGVVAVVLLHGGAPAASSQQGALQQMSPGGTTPAAPPSVEPANAAPQASSTPSVRAPATQGTPQGTQGRTPAETQSAGAERAGGASPSGAGTVENAASQAGRTGKPGAGAAPSGNPAGSPAAGAIVLSPTDVRSTLDHQMDLISLGATPPSHATLVAVRDTAVAAWGLATASAKDRAYAAYIAGNAVAALGDTAQAFSWVQRAVDLQPGERGYQQMLDLFRRPKH